MVKKKKTSLKKVTPAQDLSATPMNTYSINMENTIHNKQNYPNVNDLTPEKDIESLADSQRI